MRRQRDSGQIVTRLQQAGQAEQQVKKILIKSFTFAPVLFENILKMFSNWIHRAVAVGEEKL